MIHSSLDADPRRASRGWGRGRGAVAGIMYQSRLSYQTRHMYQNRHPYSYPSYPLWDPLRLGRETFGDTISLHYLKIPTDPLRTWMRRPSEVISRVQVRGRLPATITTTRRPILQRAPTGERLRRPAGGDGPTFAAVIHSAILPDTLLILS